MHDDPDEKFFIPDNVYIIGTMNDIDRSVDTFDFAMRRRFTFLEVTAEESAEKMELPNDVKSQMARLNAAIITDGELTKDYQIGASYFKDILESEKYPDNAPLWDTKLYPLLNDYFRGERQANEKLSKLKRKYFNDEGI
jgi:5-methylcytosine-specific restriction endonuclease McrBC GTP-binding regulatory subunit McrB